MSRVRLPGDLPIKTIMKVEKNCKIHTRPKERKWLKRLSSRLMRRLAKLLMEDAPTKLRHITRGWSD